MSRTDPKTKKDWQEAANAAHFLLSVNDARLYGLVEHDFVIDIERCKDLLAKAKAMGIEPVEWDL